MVDSMEKIVALAKNRGFVYTGSEIYGGLANTWDYGPLGVELKNNMKKAWWKKFIQENPKNVGVDCAILMNPLTWVASGHVGGFSDPLMDCKECKERFRADKLIEDYMAEKGIEPETLLRMSQVAGEVTGHTVAVLSGPSHAEEVARGIPTGCVAACGDKAAAELVQDAFMSDRFRVYVNPDVVGVELGGALKNVIALCAGISDGLGFGDNTKAMLMTRGLTEPARLGLALGARRETFTGLAGVGDLIVTCTSMHSRNRRAGILIGQGKTPEEAMTQVGAVVEGYYAARSAHLLATRLGADLPITAAAYRVLYQGADVAWTVNQLLCRDKRAETEDASWDAQWNM